MSCILFDPFAKSAYNAFMETDSNTAAVRIEHLVTLSTPANLTTQSTTVRIEYDIALSMPADLTLQLQSKVFEMNKL
jgi:hypothetical protein